MINLELLKEQEEYLEDNVRISRKAYNRSMKARHNFKMKYKEIRHEKV